MELKHILNKYVDGLGRYQITILLLLTIIRIPSVLHNMGYVFYAATPGHWCAYPKYNTLNLTTEEWKRFSIPSKKENGKLRYSKCKIYTWASGNWTNASDIKHILSEIDNGTRFSDDVKKSCDVWEYDRVSSVKNSLVTEWDMVCDRAWMKSIIASVFVIGWIIGSQMVGYSSDRWGRRVMLRVLVVGATVFGIILPFANNYVAFLVIRALLSGCMNPAAGICFTFCLEVVGDKWRSIITNAYMIVWAVGYAALAGIAYLIRDRFIFMISVAAPAVIILIPVWFIPESLTWLIAKGHQDEANRLIHKMARTNKRTLPDGLSVSVEQQKEKTKTRFQDLFRTPGMRKITLILWLNWIANGLLYYAISWNASDYHGNLYLNVFLAGLVEIPAYLLNMPVVTKLGRRWGMAGCIFIGGISMLVSLAIPEALPALKITLVMIAKFSVTMSFTTAYQYSVELYPTVIRTLGLLTCVTASRFGSLGAPFLPLIGGMWPDIICGALALVAGLLLLLLPETLNTSLCATIDEAEDRYNNNRLRDLCKCRSLEDNTHYQNSSEEITFLGRQEKEAETKISSSWKT